MRLNSNFKNCNGFQNTVAVFLCSFLIVSCGTSKIDRDNTYRINFLDEYVLDSESSVDGHKIGGLSGIDFNGEKFTLISDHSKKPVLYQADIIIERNKIKKVQFLKGQTLSCDSISIFDTESLRYKVNDNKFIISGEGSIKNNHDPVLFEVNSKGICRKIYDLPKYFKASSVDGPRSNGVFEGLTLDHDKTGFWVVNELPLKRDGKKPKLFNTNSPLRLTHYKFDDDQPDFQLSYDLDRLRKVPLLPFGLNGATELLQIDEQNVLVIERAYSAGHKSKGNRIKIFMVNVSNQKNLLNTSSLRRAKINNLKKTLLFDSKHIKKRLKLKFIDNIEGITFGPKLDNGNNSLILISDNNFNAFGKQLNQIILLELSKI
jgi:hypothetical protein